MKPQEIIYSVETIDSAVQLLNGAMNHAAVFTFTGTLGAGKTTLIQTWLKSCGVTGHITSPTFTYMNIYENDKGQQFYHFDLYRLNSLQEFIDSGFNEYLYQPKSWACIEWPELVIPLLDHAVCHVELDYYDTQRKLHLSCTSEFSQPPIGL